MFIEVKFYVVNLMNYVLQLFRYFNSSLGVMIGVIINGKEWRFFIDLINLNVMDDKLFLIVDFMKNKVEDLIQLVEFKYDNFYVEKLCFFVEEN